MKERAAGNEPANGPMLVLRAILAAMALLLLTAAQADLSQFDPYAFCWHYIQLLAGF